MRRMPQATRALVDRALGAEGPSEIERARIHNAFSARLASLGVPAPPLPQPAAATAAVAGTKGAMATAVKLAAVGAALGAALWLADDPRGGGSHAGGEVAAPPAASAHAAAAASGRPVVPMHGGAMDGVAPTGGVAPTDGVAPLDGVAGPAERAQPVAVHGGVPAGAIEASPSQTGDSAAPVAGEHALRATGPAQPPSASASRELAQARGVARRPRASGDPRPRLGAPGAADAPRAHDVADRAGAADMTDTADGPGDGLQAELRLIRAAKRALGRGEPGRALDHLAAHRRSFASGRLREERRGLRVLALCESGAMAEGQRLRTLFLQEAPRSVLIERVRAACR